MSLTKIERIERLRRFFDICKDEYDAGKRAGHIALTYHTYLSARVITLFDTPLNGIVESAVPESSTPTQESGHNESS